MSVITPQQVLELEANQNFKDVSKQFVRDRAAYIAGQDGTPGNTAGLSPVEWAKERFIAKGILLHPNSHDYNEWASQFSILLKGQDVWDTDAATTIFNMSQPGNTNPPVLAQGKFEELANLTYEMRRQRIEF